MNFLLPRACKLQSCYPLNRDLAIRPHKYNKDSLRIEKMVHTGVADGSIDTRSGGEKTRDESGSRPKKGKFVTNYPSINESIKNRYYSNISLIIL